MNVGELAFKIKELADLKNQKEEHEIKIEKLKEEITICKENLHKEFTSDKAQQRLIKKTLSKKQTELDDLEYELRYLLKSYEELYEAPLVS